MILNSYEGGHKTSIEKLISEFGNEKEEDIRRLYSEQKEIMENKSSIKNFLPFFTYKLVRETILVQYKENEPEKNTYNQ